MLWWAGLVHQGRLGQTAASQGVSPAQRVGQPVPAGHVPDEVGGVGAGHPGGGDVQRPGRGSAQHRDGVGGGAEGCLGHADHRNAELLARPGAQPGPAVGVQVGVAVDDQEAQAAHAVQHRAQRRELSQVELAWLVGRDVWHYGDAGAGQAGEGRIGGHDRSRPGTASGRVVHVRRREYGAARYHASRMPGPPRFGRRGVHPT